MFKAKSLPTIGENSSDEASSTKQPGLVIDLKSDDDLARVLNHLFLIDKAFEETVSKIPNGVKAYKKGCHLSDCFDASNNKFDMATRNIVSRVASGKYIINGKILDELKQAICTQCGISSEDYDSLFSEIMKVLW